MTQFKALSLAVIRRHSLSTQTCQQLQHGRTWTDLWKQNRKENRPSHVRKDVCFIHNKRGQDGCLTLTERQNEFVQGTTKDGKRMRANSRIRKYGVSGVTKLVL